MNQPRSAHLLPALALACLLAFWPPAPRPAAACSPPPVTPWFYETISPGAAALPAGVLLGNKSDSILVLTNTTSVPLYVIGSNHVGSYAPLDLPLPAGQGALYRLQDSQAREWAWQENEADPGARVTDWLPPSPDYRRSDALEITVGSGSLASYYRETLAEFPSAYRTGDNRPADAPLPAPRPVTLTLAYGDEVLPVPVTVAYKLNPSYKADSVAVREAFDGCGGPDAQFWLSVGASLIATPFLLWALVAVARWVGSAPEERQ